MGARRLAEEAIVEAALRESAWESERLRAARANELACVVCRMAEARNGPYCDPFCEVIAQLEGTKTEGKGTAT